MRKYFVSQLFAIAIIIAGDGIVGSAFAFEMDLSYPDALRRNHEIQLGDLSVGEHGKIDSSDIVYCVDEHGSLLTSGETKLASEETINNSYATIFDVTRLPNQTTSIKTIQGTNSFRTLRQIYAGLSRALPCRIASELYGFDTSSLLSIETIDGKRSLGELLPQQ